MNKISQIKHYTDSNTIEVTWVNAKDEIIRCHYYADVQMQMFRDDVAEIGGEISEHEELIALVESNIKPADPIPVSIPDVTPRQIRAALNELGLRAEVEAAVAQSDQTTKDAWEFSTLFVRNYPLTVALGQALNKSSDELDALFILASTK